MRTRRGVERHPTGDSDKLSEMMYQSASLREPRRRTTKVNAVTVEEEEEATAKTQQESCDEEEVVVVDPNDAETTAKKDGPIRTRRGVQRKSTGDSEQLGLMLYGLAKGRAASSDHEGGSSSGSCGGGDIPTEVSLSIATTKEPRRRGRRKSTVNVDDSENLEGDSTNNDGN